MGRNKVSVIVITLNEERNIERCLMSVQWADEIVLVDSGSADRTVEIAKSHGAKVSTRKFESYADQKNHALSLAGGDWVFSIDADEEVTPELKAEILDAAQSGVFDAYRVSRRSRIFGRWMRYTGTQNDRPIRLWKNGAAHFEQPVHEKVTVIGTTGRLKKVMLHYTYENAADYIDRLNRYTDMEARLLLETRRKPGWADFWIKPFAIFFKLYVWEKGFLDGTEGFAFSTLSGLYVFLKRAKQWELGRAANDA